VTRIGDYAFCYCNSLTSVTFGEGSNIVGVVGRNWGIYAFPPMARTSLNPEYMAANPHAGTYTRESGGTTWTKAGS